MESTGNLTKRFNCLKGNYLKTIPKFAFDHIYIWKDSFLYF